ncbi:hypothetical protein Tco_0178573 [Tanacetum coccineum]
MAAPVPVTSEVGAAAIALPTRVLELDTHSSSEADPSESSPPPVSVAHMVSPFMCLDDSESDTEMPERHVSPTLHDAMLTRWRSKVSPRSSSSTTSTLEIPTAPILPAPSAVVTPSSEFSLAPVDASPRIRRRQAILIRPREDIPISRLYRTYPGGPCRALTARKSVRPLPSHRLALRYTSHHLDRHTSRSSSGHSSSRHSISGHSLSGHASLDTTVADSSTPPRFFYPPLARTPWCSEAYLRWRLLSSLSSCGLCLSLCSLLLDCSFMLCDLDFEPLSLSLSSLPSCDLESLTNILILCLILKALNQSLRKSLSLNLELS